MFFVYGATIFVVPLCAILIIYLSGVYFVKNEIRAANEIVLEQLSNSIDAEFSELRTVATLLQTQTTFKNILYETGEVSASDRYEYTQFTQNIFPIIASAPFVKEYLLYFDAQKLMFNSTSYKLYTGLTEREFETFFVPLPNFTYLLKQDYTNKIMPLYKENTTEVESVLYITSIKGSSVGSDTVQFVATIDTTAIDSLLSAVSAYGEGMFFVMLDSTTDLPFYGNDEDVLNYLSQTNSTTLQSGQYISIYETNDYLFYTRSSSTTNVEYFLLIASDNIKNATRIIQVIALLCSAVFCAVTIIIYRMIRAREYNAIVATLSLLDVDDQNEIDDNPLEFIQNNVSSLVFGKKEIEGSLHDSQQHLQVHFLTRLLIHNVVDKESYSNLLAYHNVQFQYAKFRVFVFCKQNVPLQSMVQADYDTLLLTVQTEIRTVMSEQVQFFSVYLNGMSVMIMNYDFDFLGKEELLYASEAYQALLKQEPFVMALSRMKQDVFALHAAHNEALDAIEQCLFEGATYKVYTQEGAKRRYPEQVKYYRYEENFKKALREGNFKSADALLKNMLQLLKTSFSSQNSVVRCKLYGLLNILMSGCANNESFDMYEIEDAIKECKTNNDLYDAVVVLFRQSVKPIEKPDTFIQSVEQFVEEHYTKPMLSVGMIAEWLEMDLSVLSKRFKKERGINISDYIHLVRIRKAKVLLEQQDVTIKMIADQCGYINSDVFIRAFKRYEGVPPGKYREKKGE